MQRDETDWRHSYITLPSGRKLGYAECGSSTGKPLIYFHGGLSSRLDISFASELCRDHHVRLVAPDRPGIGTSEQAHNRSLLDWPNDVVALADYLGLDRFPVLGWSLGGPYALACAYALPERVTLAGTVGCIAPLPWQENLSDLGLFADRLLISLTRSAPMLVPPLLQLSKFIPAGIVKDLLISELRAEGDREIVRAMSVEDATDFFREALRQGVDGTVDDYRTISFDWPFSVEDIIVQVHLWHGEEDIIVPPKHGTYLEQHLPSAVLHVIAKQGHFLLHKHLKDVLQVLVP